MRVIHVIPKFTRSIWGGAESLIVDLVKAYPSDIRGEVWTCRTPGDMKEETIEGVKVKRFNTLYLSGKRMIGRGKPGIPLGLLIKVAHLSQSPGPKPVILHLHGHNALSAAVLLIARRMHGIKTVLTLHSQVLRFTPSWRYFFSNIFPIKHATHVVAVSQVIADQAKRVSGRQDIKVIPNGFDLAWIRRGDRRRGRIFCKIFPEEEIKVILFVGRMARVKNLETLIIAFSHIVQSTSVKDKKPRLVLVGPEAEPGYVNLLRRMAMHMKITQVVNFVGSVPPKSKLLADLYAASDVVVVPSKFEAQSVTVLEAWGAGRPVVVADVGGMGPMVRKWNAGFIWSPDTGAKGLAEILHRALNNCPQEIKRKILLAREHYDIKNLAREYIALYRGH